MKQTTRQDHPPEMRGMRNMDICFNAEKTRAAEIPSANGHASARGEEISVKGQNCHIGMYMLLRHDI